MQNDRTFVSYSRADGEFAVRLASDLRSRGADVWVDQLDIQAGSRWDNAIEEALRGSARILVLLSPKSVASQNVLDEVSFALDEGKSVVPVLVESCAIPMRLRRLQHVDFTRDYEGALTRLLGTLGVTRPRPAAAEPPPPEPPPREAPPARAAEPPPAAEPFAAARPSSASSSPHLLAIGVGAAAVVLIAVLATWRGGSTGESTDATPTDIQTPAVSAAPDATTAPPPAATAAAPSNTESAAAPPESRSAGAGAISGLFNSARPLTAITGTDDAGLKSLLGVTRQMERRDTLTPADLEQLAGAQSLACRGNASAACEEKASDYVDSVLTTVCGRGLGARPADEAGALRHDVSLQSCRQAYLNILLTQMELQSGEALRKIKAG